MTRADCVAWLRAHGRHWSQRPMTIPRPVVDAREASAAGMLRAVERRRLREVR